MGTDGVPQLLGSPAGMGICHQVNLEYLARVVFTTEIDGETFAYPDTLVGTDSHTTMINGLGVAGLGRGRYEARRHAGTGCEHACAAGCRFKLDRQM